jgi:polar amino acid transport system permease protein
VFANLSNFLTVLLHGVVYTVAATAGGMVLATVASLIAGLASLSESRTIRVITRIYVEGWRGTSELVQLFWVFFALPLLIHFQLIPLAAGILVLGLNFGAYGAEVVRGAVQSVPREQHESAIALNLTKAQRMRRVILPQALVEMVPPFSNLYVQLLQASALISLITVPDITYQGVTILAPNNTTQVLPIFLLMLLLYLVLSVIIVLVMTLIERWASRVAGRPQRPPRRRVPRLRQIVPTPGSGGGG